MVPPKVEIFVDERLIEGDAAAFGTIEEILMHVQSEHCGPDQLVVGVRGDGHEIPAAAMTDALRRPASTFTRLEITTGSRFQLVEDAMTDASACLAETETACQGVAELLTEGRTVEAIKTLGECLRVWQQVHDAVLKSVEMLRINAEHTDIGAGNLIDAIAQPREILLQVRDALQNRDHVLLADLLRYEFSEVTDKWHSVLGRLRREAEERRSAHPS